MPYLTHADAEAAKAAEVQAAARSKIAPASPRSPLRPRPATARLNGSTFALKRSARSRRRSATRRSSSAPPPGSSSSCSRGCAASRGPRARVGGTVAAPNPEFVPEQNPSFVLAEVPVPPGKAPKKGANKVGKEKSDKALGPKELKVWAEKHDVALVQYALAAGYPRLSVTGGKGKSSSDSAVAGLRAQ
ncbi:hypothetical protein T492DRAFT_1105622 [Pavlovales sp. CCMP2436]|nr:hypothetical protein T492DRAFT_1105622 [Pavlovales sp. CCMP2436]